MTRLPFTTLASRLVPLTVITLALAACGSDGAAEDDQLAADTPGTGPAVEAAAPREALGPATSLPANELGEILVLEYHRLGLPETEYRRSVENFRLDIERLYQAGFRPITLRQMISGDIDVPRGTTPVVFTIDDSSEGQFYFLEDGTIDPNSMVGIWDAFRAENPEWEGGATWCVLPAADYPSNFFGEKPTREVPREEREARIHRKVTYLIDTGHEICNHTLYHARLDRAVSEAQVQEWIGRGEDSIRVYLPQDYDVVTLALPLGMWPKDSTLAYRGNHAGRDYVYEAVLEVTGGPSKSPFDAEFDPLSITRVPVAPTLLERHLETYEKQPERRFISDGDPGTITVTATEAARVAADRWPGKEIRLLDAAE